MEKLKQLWNGFEEKYPKASQWVREGGLFVIVSNVITLFKSFRDKILSYNICVAMFSFNKTRFNINIKEE